MLLDDRDLASMRATVSGSLPGTAVIGSDQYAGDSGGGGTLTFVSSGTVDCRIAPVGGNVANEELTGGRISPYAEYVVTLPFGTDVDESDRLTIDGTPYEVVALRAPRSFGVSERVEVKKA